MGYENLCCVSADWNAYGLLFDIGDAGVKIQNAVRSEVLIASTFTLFICLVIIFAILDDTYFKKKCSLGNKWSYSKWQCIKYEEEKKSNDFKKSF